MIEALNKIVADGRSTPGAPQLNHARVDIWRGGPPFVRAPSGPN
jgi:hypothetical protein